MQVSRIIALNAVDATTTSAKIWIGDFDKVAVLCRRADNAGGSSTFTFKAGFDSALAGDPTMTAYNMMVDNLVNTNAQFPVRLNSKAISAANGDVMLWMDPNYPATHLEVTATEVGDGTHSAFILGFTEC